MSNAQDIRKALERATNALDAVGATDEANAAAAALSQPQAAPDDWPFEHDTDENGTLRIKPQAAQPAAVASAPLEGKYGNVLAPFLSLMEAELHANARKGDRPGWLAMPPSTALLEIYWHTAKLSAAVKNNDAALIREHSADVANMAMMLLDVCGGIDVAATPPTEPAPQEPGNEGAP